MKKKTKNVNMTHVNGFSYWIIACVMLVFGVIKIAFAEDPTATSVVQDFFSALGSMKGMQWQLAAASFITILISALKVSAWRPLWNKLGWFKAFLAPMLSIFVVMLTAMSAGNFGWKSAVTALVTGGGALAIHELLDSFKGIPGIGGTWLAIIEWVSKMLGGSVTVSSMSAKK